MALLKSTQVTRRDPIMTGDRASSLVVSFADYVLTGSEVQNDVIEMLGLPAGHVPVDMILDAQDCGTTFTVDCGVLSGAYLDTGARTCGAEFMNDKALGTAGIYRLDVVGGNKVAPSTTNRSIGFKVDAAVAALTAGATLRLTLLCRPAVEGA